MSSPATSSPASTMSSTGMPWRAQMLLEGEALRSRIAEAELELGRRIEAAIGQVAAAPWRRRGPRASPRRTWRRARARHAASCGAARARPPRGSPPAAPCRPARPAAPPPPGTTALRSSSRNRRCCRSCRDEKSNQAIFWSLTKKEGVFSLLKGESPLHSCPDFLSFTRRPTTSETGRRARSSSRNSGEKRMVICEVSPSPPGI